MTNPVCGASGSNVSTSGINVSIEVVVVVGLVDGTVSSTLANVVSGGVVSIDVVLLTGGCVTLGSVVVVVTPSVITTAAGSVEPGEFWSGSPGVVLHPAAHKATPTMKGTSGRMVGITELKLALAIGLAKSQRPLKVGC